MPIGTTMLKSASLPALAFSTKLGSVIYLSAFAGGTVIAMTLFSSAIGLTIHSRKWNGIKAYRFLMIGCSAAALVIGGYWLVS